MKIIFGYWDLRGLGQSIRFMLKYLNIDYQEIRYKLGDSMEDPNYREDWLKDKFRLGLDFPNIPYYIEGDIKLTHSKAIMRYLGRKYGLMGRTETENIRIDIIENQIEDFRYNGLRNVVYLPVFDKSLDFEKLREEYLSNIDNYLKEISDFLSDNEWMAGNHITYVDFWAYEILDWNRLFKSDCLNKHQNLAEYLERFESLPAIKQYINSSEFKRFPIFAPYAKWGG